MTRLVAVRGPQAPARLRRRAEFLAVAKGARLHLGLLSLQALRRPESAEARFGLTVTKKEGGAVERNRMRRRLREALRTTPGLAARSDHDYVIIARKELLHAGFVEVQAELLRALAKMHRDKAVKTSKSGRAGPQATKDRAAEP